MSIESLYSREGSDPGSEREERLRACLLDPVFRSSYWLVKNKLDYFFGIETRIKVGDGKYNVACWPNRGGVSREDELRVDFDLTGEKWDVTGYNEKEWFNDKKMGSGMAAFVKLQADIVERVGYGGVEPELYDVERQFYAYLGLKEEFDNQMFVIKGGSSWWWGFF